MKDATVCIVTYNGDEFLDELIQKIYDQKTTHTYDVLVIDSGSKDQTLDIVKSYPDVRLVEIDNSEFGHGKTRNKAVELSDSEFVVFLTQDAVPNNFMWLESILEPFYALPEISCVFGRQVPRKDCVVSVKREVDLVFSGFGDNASWSIQRHSAVTEHFRCVNYFFSDVNSAVRKSCMAEVPFRDLNYAEDQALAQDHMKHGWLKAYAPLAEVEHSHNYKPKKFFHRKMDEMLGAYAATGQLTPMSPFRAVRRTITGTLRDWIYIFHDRHYSAAQKISNFFKAPIYNFLLIRCYWLARNPHQHELLRKHSLEDKVRAQEQLLRDKSAREHEIDHKEEPSSVG